MYVTTTSLISLSPNTFNFLTITHLTQEKMRGAMKDKGKAVATSSTSSNWFSDYYPSYELPCKKHPSSSSVGICAYCLKDRLVKLVCSDCGEQRLSSCSCSDISSSYPNSCTVDIGSVGRISFLIENDKDGDSHSLSNVKSGSELRSEAAALLKRSSSTSTSVVDVKKGGFWRLGRLFRKKRERDNDVDEKSEMWDAENMGVSRSRSVCEGSFNVSTGRPSDINSLGDSEKRNSGFSGIHPPSTSSFNGVKRDGSLLSDFKGVDKGSFIEFDGNFNGGDDPGFIDLKLSLASESKPEFSCLRGSNFLESESGCRISRDCDPSGLRRDEGWVNSGCRDECVGDGDTHVFSIPHLTFLIKLSLPFLPKKPPQPPKPTFLDINNRGASAAASLEQSSCFS